MIDDPDSAVYRVRVAPLEAMNGNICRILMIGDVVSAVGTEKLTAVLPRLKKEYAADVTVANGENAAVGNGLTRQAAEQIFRRARIVLQAAIIRFAAASFMNIWMHPNFACAPKITENPHPDAAFVLWIKAVCVSAW